MLHTTVSAECRQYLDSLRVILAQHEAECELGHAPTLAAIRRIADVFEAGRFLSLHTSFAQVNRRLYFVPVDRGAAPGRKLLRKKLAHLRLAAREEQQDDSALAELAYALATSCRVLGMPLDRTTRLSDGANDGSYPVFFHQVVMTATPDASR